MTRFAYQVRLTLEGAPRATSPNRFRCGGYEERNRQEQHQPFLTLTDVHGQQAVRLLLHASLARHRTAHPLVLSQR